MNFEFSEMQQMLVDSASRLMKEAGGVEYWRDRRAHSNGSDPALWGQFAELGWLALAVPEDAGGLGCSMEDVALLMVELGRGLSLEPVVTSGVLAAHVIDKLATGDQRMSLLGAIAAGETRMALAHDEPDDRFTITAPRQAEALRRDGSFVLSGTKVLALDAPSAHHLLVTASIAGEAAFGIFLVPVTAQGLTLSAYTLVDGTCAADVELAEVAVSQDALLGQGPAAQSVLAHAIDRANLALMAQAVGAMEAAVTIASEYAKERKQFGQPIGKFQAIQHLAADAFVASYQARSALYQLLAAIDEADEVRARAVAIARIMIGEAGQIVGRNGIQIHGGYGVTDEYAISHFYRRLFSLERQFGDSEFYLKSLARSGEAVR